MKYFHGVKVQIILELSKLLELKCLSALSASLLPLTAVITEKDVLQVTAAISRTPFSHTCLTDLQKCKGFAMRLVI